MRECKKCGKCCETIPMAFSFESYTVFQQWEIDFMKEHWKPIAKPSVLPNKKAGRLFDNVKWYRCDMLNEDGTCNSYKQRPRFCKDYPAMEANQTLISDKCAFAGGVDNG